MCHDRNDLGVLAVLHPDVDREVLLVDIVLLDPDGTGSQIQKLGPGHGLLLDHRHLTVAGECPLTQTRDHLIRDELIPLGCQFLLLHLGKLGQIHIVRINLVDEDVLIFDQKAVVDVDVRGTNSHLYKSSYD